jgi:hypothetical protein
MRGRHREGSHSATQTNSSCYPVRNPHTIVQTTKPDREDGRTRFLTVAASSMLEDNS